MMERDDEPTQMRVRAGARRLGATPAATRPRRCWDVLHRGRARHPVRPRRSAARCARCPAASRSGSCSRRCCAGPTRSCCSTSPTTTSTCPASGGSRSGCAETPKTVLFVSHDRELLARAADRVVTVELGRGRQHAWVHGGGFATYHEARARPLRPARGAAAPLGRGARQAQGARADVPRRRPPYNDGMASRYQAAQTRLRKFEEAGPPPRAAARAEHRDAAAAAAAPASAPSSARAWSSPADEAVRPGGLVRRAGRRARLQRLGQVALPAAAAPADDPWREHAGGDVATPVGAPACVPGLVRADPRPPRAAGRTLLEILHRGDEHAGMPRTRRCRALRPLRAGRAGASRPSRRSPAASRPGSRSCCSSWPGATLLLLDEPTDNLDLASRRGARGGPGGFEGTVLAVTHDRWFARGFDRFLVFGADGDGLRDGRAGVGRDPGGPPALRTRPVKGP